ncbi:MAG: zf-TFIIB domain-containing protein [Sandaracinaceae bacterium]
MTPEPCDECGGSLGPSAALPPCLCELGPPEPIQQVKPPESKGGDGSQARALRCPSCGGWLESGMRHCTYCSVELASVRCWRCFDLSFAGNPRCAGCGATLGLEGDLGETGSNCPDCKQALHLIEVGEHRVKECTKCGGLQVDHETLSHLTHARETESGVTMPGQVKRQSLQAGSVSYRGCPTCEVIMTPRNFGGRSGILIDVCKIHGVWFDEDELTHVLDFVASGGLRDHRKSQIRDAEAELSRRRLDNLFESRSHTRLDGHTHSAGAFVSVLGKLFF